MDSFVKSTVSTIIPDRINGWIVTANSFVFVHMSAMKLKRNGGPFKIIGNKSFGVFSVFISNLDTRADFSVFSMVFKWRHTINFDN